MQGVLEPNKWRERSGVWGNLTRRDMVEERYEGGESKEFKQISKRGVLGKREEF